MRTLVFALLCMAGCAAGDGAAPPDLGPDLALDCPPGSHPSSGACATSFTWTERGALAPPRDHHATFVVEANGQAWLYVAGGTDHFLSTVYDDVQRAAISPDGTLGSFTVVGHLPAPLASMGVTVVGDPGSEIVVIAGGVEQANGTLGFSTDTLSAKVGDDGMLGPWQTQPAIPIGREHTALLARGQSLYLVGGLIGRTGTPDVERTTIAGDGTIAPWTRATPLPEERSHHAALIVDGAIYVTGGLKGDPGNPDSYSDVLRAPLGDDGSVGAWSTVGMLPYGISTHSVIAVGGALFVVGGLQDGSVFIDDVLRAPIHDDGTLGDFADVEPLLRKRGHVLETPVWHDLVFSVDGYTNDETTITNVDVARFN